MVNARYFFKIKIAHDQQSSTFKKRKLKPRGFPSASLLGTVCSSRISFSPFAPHLPSLSLEIVLSCARDAEMRKIEFQGLGLPSGLFLEDLQGDNNANDPLRDSYQQKMMSREEQGSHRGPCQKTWQRNMRHLVPTFNKENKNNMRS